MIPVIVQTVDEPNQGDRSLVHLLRGHFVEHFTIIPAFVADLPPQAVESIILSDRVVAVTLNAKF